MRIVIAYIAVCNGPITEEYAARFVTTWNEFPPGIEHDTIVISNGGSIPSNVALIFSPMNARLFVRSNDGWDIQGYIEAARGPCADYDAILCLGESVYFHRAGWLGRLAFAWGKYGPGMYGPFSSNVVMSHLNTTAFFTSPKFLANYPKKVSTRQDRYEFEHHRESFWRRLSARGLPVRLVTWDGEWEPRMWRAPRNILWRGDQSNLLMFCNHSDAYLSQPEKVRASWRMQTDTVFR